MVVTPCLECLLEDQIAIGGNYHILVARTGLDGKQPVFSVQIYKNLLLNLMVAIQNLHAEDV